ncbi:MAG TPA: DNA-3-methyladenine glycosylase [Polyangiaceae bacterium]|nr:DNA-3-methyladenine glycosylase [Polyangiaceae bacterium]
MKARDLTFDVLAAVDHVRRADPALGRVVDAVGAFRIELLETPNVFGALSRAIVYQQLHDKAAATIFGRVQALFPKSAGGPTARQILGAPEDKLRGAGLSRSKLLSLRDLAQHAEEGRIPTLAQVRKMEDEAIIEHLTQVRGIGRWTAQMLLIFRLGRPDVLPIDDYGIRKGFGVAFRKRDLPSPRDVEKRGDRWRPYRTVASWYLWRAADRAKAR